MRLGMIVVSASILGACDAAGGGGGGGAANGNCLDEGSFVLEGEAFLLPNTEGSLTVPYGKGVSFFQYDARLPGPTEGTVNARLFTSFATSVDRTIEPGAFFPIPGSFGGDAADVAIFAEYNPMRRCSSKESDGFAGVSGGLTFTAASESCIAFEFSGEFEDTDCGDGDTMLFEIEGTMSTSNVDFTVSY
ncbi:MAG: hypothetical protein AAGA48_04740 [Myxococcota bacterium]